MHSFKEELDSLKQDGLFRQLRLIESSQGSHVSINNQTLLNLCSNDYLGLCNDSRLKIAAIEAIKKYGFGSGASRLVCGNMLLHEMLEEVIAEFKETESALVFNSGYCANLGMIAALSTKDDIIFSDRFNHASILDGAILSRAKLRRYPHKDMFSLESLLKQASLFKRRLIVTDTVFSMDGDLAPLYEILNLADKYDCFVFLDEAHATGVLGSLGKGALEYFNIKSERFIQMGTLSKALGGFGAYVCGSKTLIDYFINKARAFIYTTALPPSVCASAITAFGIIKNDDSLRNKLRHNLQFFRDGLRERGFKVLDDPTPIIPLLVNDIKKTMDFSRLLFEAGIFLQAIRPPTVPKGTSRLRITVSAAHKEEDLEFALDKIKMIGKQLGVI